MSLPARNAIYAFFITLAIIGTVIYAINYLDQKRIEEIRAIEAQLSTDTLSLETQFSLLEGASCEDLAEGSILSAEVGSLGDRLAFTEQRLGSDNVEVLRLKKQYTLFQIRDYILTNRIAEKCDVNPTIVLYFYSTTGDCEDCARAGYALSYLREKYPALRVYSFDYKLDLGALKTLVAIERVNPAFPAFVIDGERHYGFEDAEALEALLPEELLLTATTTTATSTGRTR